MATFLHNLKTVTAFLLVAALLGLGSTVFMLHRAVAQQGPTGKSSQDRQKGEPGINAKAAAKSEDAISAGDLLLIQVTGNSLGGQFSGVYRVEPSGTVPFRLINDRVKLAGQGLEQAEKTLLFYLHTKLNPPFSVQISHLRQPGIPVQKGNVTARTDDAIRVGELLFIQVTAVLPDEQIHGVYRVESTGTVPLGPKYGRVKLVGQSLEQAEKTLTTHVLTKIFPPVGLQITYYDPAMPLVRTQEVEALRDRVDQLEKETKALRESLRELRGKERH